MVPEVLKRYSEPSKFDYAPLNTICHVYILKDEYDIYIQTSPDEENPRWELLEERVPVIANE